MSAEPKLPLPGNLKARLDLIIQSAHRFWENCPHYPHFVITSLTHSDRIHRLLAQLAQELPRDNQLTADEVFIVSAAAYLFEIGLQSPRLRPILDFDCPLGTLPTQQQLLEIRNQKHLLTQKLIIDSIKGDSGSLSLSLSSDDDYSRLIADVCRWISDDPLTSVPEELPVHGIMIRLRLLVALLRLADQLYVDSARVNLDLLKRAGLQERVFARWWAYHYTQTLPIEKGQIRFHYFLPSEQREYLGHIRALIEPDFEFVSNATMRCLLDDFNVRLIPPHNPSLGRYDQSTIFQRPMSDEMITYLRQEVHPIFTPSDTQQEQASIEGDLCLLVIDYENLIVQLGHEGFFFSLEQINHYVAQLRGQAVREHGGTITGLALGHWNRPDLREAAKALDKLVYNLITLEDNQDPSELLSDVLKERTRSNNPPKRTILVAPRVDMARTVLHLKQSGQGVSTWITADPDSEVFKGGFGNKYNMLSGVLKLDKPYSIDRLEFEVRETACILRLHSLIDEDDSSHRKVNECLEQVEQLDGAIDWWRSWLLFTGILRVKNDNPDTYYLNEKHSSVMKVTQMRTTVIEALSDNLQGMGQDKLLKELRTRESALFRQDGFTLRYLELLKDEEVIRRDSSTSDRTQFMWQVNTAHVHYISRNPEHSLAPFAVSFDHVALRDGHYKLHEHNLLRTVSSYVGESTVEAVYQLAQRQGWIKRRETNEELRRGTGNLVIVGLNEDNEAVGRALRNRNILINYLNGRNAKDGLDQDVLWRRLKAISSFNLDDEEFNILIRILQRDDVVLISHNDVSNVDNIRINKSSPLTQKLFGRMHLYGLVRTLRQLKATSAEKKRSIEEVMDPLMRYVTNNDEDAARWTLTYARTIGLVEPLAGKDGPSENISELWLAHHPFVKKLDNREAQTCQHLVELVRTLIRNHKDGWVPQAVVYAEMDKKLEFGYSREEQEYWMDQTIYRLHLLSVEKRGPNGKYVKSTPK